MAQHWTFFSANHFNPPRPIKPLPPILQHCFMMVGGIVSPVWGKGRNHTTLENSNNSATPIYLDVCAPLYSTLQTLNGYYVRGLCSGGTLHPPPHLAVSGLGGALDLHGNIHPPFALPVGSPDTKNQCPDFLGRRCWCPCNPCFLWEF